MAVKVRYMEEEVHLTKIQENTKDKSFDLCGRCYKYDEELKISVKYKLEVDCEYDYTNFEVHILNNSKCTENSIFQVYDREYDQRLGWIFPIQALVSSEHDYSEDKYFLKYAFVAFRILLNGVYKKSKIPKYEEELYDLTDFYDSNLIVFVIDKENTAKIEDYNYDNYIPGLYKYGYCINGENELEYFREINKKIKLDKISPSLRSESYIKDLFSQFLGSERSDLLKFYLIYQVIELLLQKIFNQEFEEMIGDISRDKKLSFNVKDDLQNIAKEKYRIGELFTKYSNCKETQLDLKDECNKLLVKHFIKEGTSVDKSLYSVRNLFVHSYREVGKDDDNIISNIVKYFEMCIIELITTGLYETNSNASNEKVLI